jgi:cytochrome c oxidase subunit 2
MRDAIPSPFDAHSPEARAIAGLFEQTLAICSIIGVTVALLVAWCVVRFRAGKRPAEPPQVHGHKWLELGWTLVPLAIVVDLLVATSRTMAASDPAPERAPDLIVIGHQWWWEIRYASGAVTANEIHIPVGRDLLVRVESADVVHDFWVPQLGRKVDAIPGRPTFVWLQADAPGTYLGACSEYCGAEHAWMRIVVVADSPPDFATWERHEREPEPAITTAAARRGQAAFRTRTCVACHAIAGEGEPARIAPDLTHLAERTTLGAGVLPNDPMDLGRWLREPQVVKPGSHMPDLNLTDGEVDDLVAYFETLR